MKTENSKGRDYELVKAVRNKRDDDRPFGKRHKLGRAKYPSGKTPPWHYLASEVYGCLVKAVVCLVDLLLSHGQVTLEDKERALDEVNIHLRKASKFYERVEDALGSEEGDTIEAEEALDVLRYILQHLRGLLTGILSRVEKKIYGVEWPEAE